VRHWKTQVQRMIKSTVTSISSTGKQKMTSAKRRVQTLIKAAAHVGTNEEWAGGLEAEILAHLIDRPIVVLQPSMSDNGQEFNAQAYNIFSRRASTMNIALTISNSDDLLEEKKLPIVVGFDGKVHLD